jgi:hypothetical protein
VLRRLTDAERLQHLPALNPTASMLAPHVARERSGLSGPLKELRLARPAVDYPTTLLPRRKILQSQSTFGLVRALRKSADNLV